MLDSITNTMTDRHIVNSKVNETVRTSRPNPSRSWNEFNCAVHPLDSFAKAADKALLAYEKSEGLTASQIRVFTNRGGSCTKALSFAVSKAFHKEGSGVPYELKVFMKSKGLPANLVQYVVGERFNVYFRNAGAVIVVAPHLLEFLEKVWGQPNSLLQAICADIKNPLLLVTSRAHGLISKAVTGNRNSIIFPPFRFPMYMYIRVCVCVCVCVCVRAFMRACVRYIIAK